MKKAIKLLIPFAFIGIFILSCVASGRLSHSFLEERYAKPVSNIADIQSQIMVFANDDIFTIPAYCLADTACFDGSKRNWFDYSFLVPKEKEAFYQEKFSKKTEVPFFSFKVEQLSPDRQLIQLTSTGSTTYGKLWYEATDKQIYPIKYLDSNDIVNYQLLVSLFGSIFVCSVLYFIYKRFVKSAL